MSLWTRSLIGCVSILFAGFGTARAGIILNENFDELGTAFSAMSVGAFHTLDGTNVDIVGPSDGFGPLCAAPESGNCVDMDGTGGNPQGMLQTVNTITLVPGVNYYLSFDLIGSQRGFATSTTVTFASYSQTFSLASGDDSSGIVMDQLITVSTPTMTNLTFTSNTPGDYGAILDDVLVTTAPEPPAMTMILMGAALIGFGMLRIRRKASRT